MKLRVMLDTNILVSAILFPSPTVERFLKNVTEHHQVILCDYVIDELKKVVQDKFPHKMQDTLTFLREFQFEMISSPEGWDKNHIPEIRDTKDEAILATAILKKVDILVTGDKDFLVLSISEPRIMTMAEFTTAFDS